MNNSDYKISKLKQTLNYCREQGKTEIVLILTANQVEYLIRHGYYAKPIIYCIVTSTSPKTKENGSGIIRIVEKQYKMGKRVIYRNLKHQEKKALKRNDITFYPYKYKVFL